MKILYGIQGTGNGHLTRARVLAPALAEAGIHVQYLFSSRPREHFFDMDPFGDWWWRKGLSFATHNGRVSHLRTLMKSTDIIALLKDIHALDLSRFDLILTDFEPVTAWAARLQNKPIIGLGHQYAFRHMIPKCRGGLLARALMRWYAPARTKLGLHWHHFDQPILPPLVEPPPPEKTEGGGILVYLPFESLDRVRTLLTYFRDHQFLLYSGEVSYPEQHGNTALRPFSRSGFQRSLSRCDGVICNAGFELISESLHAGKKVLTKPLKGQWEQCSNALALKTLGWGRVMETLDRQEIEQWIQDAPPVRIRYPDVAREIVSWITSENRHIDANWVKSVWNRTRIGYPDMQEPFNRHTTREAAG